MVLAEPIELVALVIGVIIYLVFSVIYDRYKTICRIIIIIGLAVGVIGVAASGKLIDSPLDILARSFTPYFVAGLFLGAIFRIIYNIITDHEDIDDFL